MHTLKIDIKEKKEYKKKVESIGGCFQKYADSSKMELEDKAWKIYVMEKYRKKIKAQNE